MASGRCLQLAWAAGVCKFRHLQLASAQGAVLSYKSCIAVRRVVWYSPRFAQEHRDLHGLVIAMVRRPDSKWQLWQPDNLLQFAARVLALKQQKRNRIAIALVMADEKATVALQHGFLKFTAADAMLYFVELDPVRCSSGICGR